MRDSDPIIGELDGGRLSGAAASESAASPHRRSVPSAIGDGRATGSPNGAAGAPEQADVTLDGNGRRGAGLGAGAVADTVERVADAVVFDCDGTLADSEPLAWRSWEVVLARYGHRLTEADFAEMVGRSYAQAHADVAARVGALPAVDALWDELSEVLFELIQRELRPFGDAVSTARLLAEHGVPLAVASSSPRSRVDVTLRVLGLAELFDVTVAGDEVAAAKPSPDVYLAAAARLGVPASRCLAIEDSPVGVESARAAGMWTLAVRRGAAKPSSLAAADAVVDRLDPGMVARLVGRTAGSAGRPVSRRRS